MKKMITMSLIAAASTVAFASTASDIENLQSQIDKLKSKQGKINAQSANDNIKWGVDFRTAYDNINYDMANGDTRKNSSLYSMRLWLNMAYAPDAHNIFKGQLSMNKAFGADFGNNRGWGMDTFDWIGNEALTNNTLKVRQAYWLYLGDEAFGADIPWTMSIGRRPSTNGFLANLSQDDAAGSPLAHIINMEFDGLSSKLDLSNVTGIPGMSFKICVGYGSTNAVPMFADPSGAQYVRDENVIDDVKLAGFIFEPYNDGQYIAKFTYFKAFDLPDMTLEMGPEGPYPTGFDNVGDMEGAALSVLIDGLTDEGYMADVKLFGSFAWSKTSPDSAGVTGMPMPGMSGPGMLGTTDSETGTSYWFGAYLPVGEGNEYGTVGLEYNHGSEYWRSFTYGEDTMIGSKMAARGDAWEANYTYQINDALSFQARYVNIDYDYTGSNGFFGNSSGTPMKIDDLKEAAGMVEQMGGAQGVMQAIGAGQISQEQGTGMLMAAQMLPTIVESAQDFRMYLRYRF